MGDGYFHPALLGGVYVVAEEYRGEDVQEI